MRIKIFSTLAVLTLLIGCATNSKVEYGDSSLAPTEGIVITKIHNNSGRNIVLSVHKATSNWPITTITSPMQSSVLRVHKIEVGTVDEFAYISRITMGNYYVKTKLAGKRFMIKPGKINYIGDFKLDFNSDSPLRPRYGSVKSYFYDNEKETIKQAKELYPKLFEKYPYYSRFTDQDLLKKIKKKGGGITRSREAIVP